MPSFKLMFWRFAEGASAETLIDKARKARQRGGKFLQLARYYELRLRKEYACHIAYKANFGSGLRLPHPVGIVVGDGATVGANATIYQNVTIGAARMGDGEKGLYPVIGNNVTIFAGAALIGAIRVGDNAVVAANAVVVKDVPANCVAVGVPATIKPRKADAAVKQTPVNVCPA